MGFKLQDAEIGIAEQMTCLIQITPDRQNYSKEVHLIHLHFTKNGSPKKP
jgi:hypothetical protein